MADLRVPLYPQEKDASKCIVTVTGEDPLRARIIEEGRASPSITGVASQAPPGSSPDRWSLDCWQLVRQLVTFTHPGLP